MIYKVHYQIAGGHVHCALFTSKSSNHTWQKCGDFVTDAKDIDNLKAAMQGIEFIEVTPND